MHVIGTAGHVDHGKTTLITALTGINPDRLKEEKERQMTTDLGFAWMTLPGGEIVGIVDVPGHRDFIENMLAGVGGIDAVLLVIAANEGVMPQTREHLAILDLLGVKVGVIVLTKIDLVKDSDWLNLVQSDINQLVSGSTLEGAPIVKVSTFTGVGMSDLISKIEECVSTCPPRHDFGRPRLPIDRVFSMSGFGTIVTGTLLDGKLKIGDEIEILPGQKHGRIRGLQTYKQKQEEALPGNRTAINLTGIDVKQIRRGDIVVKKGTYQVSKRLDVSYESLKNLKITLHHNDAVKIYLGSAEINARARVLGGEEVQPNGKGYLQLELETPTVAIKGDHFILRQPTPAETLGGGVILDPFPLVRHKRFSPKTIDELRTLDSGNPEDFILQVINKFGTISLSNLKEKIPDSDLSIRKVIQTLLSEKKISLLGGVNSSSIEDQILVSARTLDQINQEIRKKLTNFLLKNPLRFGMKREELRSEFQYSQTVFDSIINELIESGFFIVIKNLIGLPGREIQFSYEQEKVITKLIDQFSAHPYNPPLVNDCIDFVGKEVFQALLDQMKLVQVSSDVVFSRVVYEEMLAKIRSLLISRGKVTLAEVRDSFHTSRRYALAILEHMDQSGLTIREGDYRKLTAKG